MSSRDLFSGHANLYAAFRPTYPHELYEFIFNHVHHFDAAWDAGTGNGQVARDLSKKFKEIFATDISEKQLINAVPAENIFYSVAGEKSSFPDKSMDLITVAQAIHWFDIPRFYEEVNRVGKHGSVLAIWGYGLLSINQLMDEQIAHFYTQIVGPYWDKARKLVDDRYQTIPFPFPEIKTPFFNFSFHWTMNELQGYLTTWSSVQKYVKSQGEDPVPDLIQQLKPYWTEERMRVEFPLFLRLGKI